MTESLLGLMTIGCDFVILSPARPSAATKLPLAKHAKSAKKPRQKRP
jgi:hypothetical protein